MPLDRPVVALCCGAHFLVCSAEVVFGASVGPQWGWGWNTKNDGDSIAKYMGMSENRLKRLNP